MTAAPSERLDAHAFRTRIDGGPVVLSERMASIRSVAVGFWVRQGRIHEDADQDGVSHLLEHMAFKGTPRRSPRELAHEIERVGGVLDAYTTHEATAYQARVPAAHLDLAVDVLSDMTFAPSLRERDLDVERQVVLEEISAVEDAPEDVAFEAHARFLYGGHPYGEPIIGSRASVTDLSLDALRAVHARAYRPSNLVVAAAGAVDHDALVRLVAAHLPAETADGPSRTVPPVEARAGTRRMEREGARQAHLIVGALSVPYRDPSRYAVVLASTALGGGMSSRLFQRIREEAGLAYSVYGFHCFFGESGHVGAYVGTSPGTLEEARSVLLDELELLAREGLGADELDDTRAQLKGQIIISLESPVTRMNRLAGSALYDHTFRTVDDVAALLDSVGPDDCLAAGRLFHPERAAILELTPA